MKQAITGASVFDGESMLHQHTVIVEGTSIIDLIPDADLDATIVQHKLDGGIIAPGFIDLQVNGGGGVLLNNDPSEQSIKTILKAHREKGTTSLLPTILSDDQSTLDQAINTVSILLRQKLPGILGIHIEGPFFSLEKRGVHAAAKIRPLLDQDVQWLVSKGNIPIMLTLAPEKTTHGQIKILQEAGITVCAGHSDALSEDIDEALDQGLAGFTHLFNAMRGMESREPGVVGAALADNDSYCSIIADGHHVHPNMIKIAYTAKAQGKLYLVSDAMATVGGDQDFKLYGETISEQQGRLINSEGKLAGSAIGLIDAVRISHQLVGLPLEECLKMASLYPAQFIGADKMFGRIQSGFTANLVHFDENFCVQHTWLDGCLAQHNIGK